MTTKTNAELVKLCIWYASSSPMTWKQIFFTLSNLNFEWLSLLVLHLRPGWWPAWNQFTYLTEWSNYPITLSSRNLCSERLKPSGRQRPMSWRPSPLTLNPRWRLSRKTCRRTRSRSSSTPSPSARWRRGSTRRRNAARLCNRTTGELLFSDFATADDEDSSR